MTLSHLFGGPFAAYLEWLLRASVSATFIGAMVLLIQLLFGRWLTPAWRYRLWIVMVVRLLLPALPASPMSFSNFDLSDAIRRTSVSFRNDYASHRTPGDSPSAAVGSVDAPQPNVKVVYGMPAPAVRQLVLQTTTQPPSPMQEPRVRLPTILFSLWLAGVVVFLARLLAANCQLARRLRHAALATDVTLLDRFRECCDRARIGRPPELLITRAVRIPATAGLWRPRILLPPGLFEGLSDQQQRAVLLHELAHYKCRDVLSNWVLAAAQIIHWFNPAIAGAIGRLKVDREMARDAMALRWIENQDASVEREQYARTLLDLTESLSTGPRCLGMAAGLAGICTPEAGFTSGSFGHASALKRRLQMIRTSDHSVRRSTLLGTLLVAVLVVCTLTRAQERSAPAPATSPAPANVLQERQTGPSGSDEMLVAEARALITSHKYDEAITVLREVRVEDPKSKLLDEVVPKLLRQIETEQKREKATHEEVQKQLDRILPEVSFNAVGFSDVIDFMRDVSGANIFVNWKSLETANIERDAPITARLRSIRFSKALSIILDAAGGGHGKLGFTIDEGVITISTVDDLSKNVQARVYDVRDLLVTPPSFVWPPMGRERSATTQLSGRPDMDGARDAAVKGIIQLIQDTVAPQTWKDRGGTVAAIREMQGQLIITQTPENQLQIIKLLDQLRDAKSIKFQVDAQYISCDESVARDVLAQWQKKIEPATRPSINNPPTTQATSQAVGFFLDDDQVKEFVRESGAKRGSIVLGAPRIFLLDSQRAYVQESAQTNYLGDYAATTVAGDQMRYDPIRAQVDTGLLLEVQATASADRKSIRLSLRPRFSALVGMKQVPWPGRPAGSNLMVQEPQIRSIELQTTVDIPDGQTLLLGGLEDPRAAADAQLSAAPQFRSLILLVRPKLIVGSQPNPYPRSSPPGPDIKP